MPHVWTKLLLFWGIYLILEHLGPQGYGVSLEGGMMFWLVPHFLVLQGAVRFSGVLHLSLHDVWHRLTSAPGLEPESTNLVTGLHYLIQEGEL